MITERLPPVDRTAEISIEEIAESLALTYWAYYNAEPVQPRVNDAYRRAWGLDSYKFFPRVLPRPGFVTTFSTLPYRKVMTVAIEGTTSLSQLSPMLEASVSWNMGVPKWAYNFFVNQADAIYAKLHEDTDTAAAIANGMYMFTFTGHSLGAACADILAFRFRQNYPSKNVRLIKFGCPRVGNTFYVNRTGPLAVRSRNVYCGNDPIHQFPSSTVFATGLLNVLGTATRLNSCSEDTRYVLNLAGGAPYTANTENTQSSGHFLDTAAAFRTFDTSNIWWNHMMKTYRLAMMNLASRSADMLKYRFNYLEHNDENRWQNNHTPGTLTWEYMDGVSVTQPDAVRPISTQVSDRTKPEAPQPPERTPSPMDETDNDVAVNRQIVPTLPPPVETYALPRRRFTRSRPN